MLSWVEHENFLEPRARFSEEYLYGPHHPFVKKVDDKLKKQHLCQILNLNHSVKTSIVHHKNRNNSYE